MRFSCAVVVFYLAVSSLASCQESKADLFGGYSYLNIDTNGLTSRQSANGWEASISGNVIPWFAVETDVSGYYKNRILGSAVNVRDYSFAAGPRFNFRPFFVHALLGADRLSAVSAAQDSFTGVLGGGIQWKVHGPVSVRVSADYAFTNHNIFGGPAYAQNNVRASAGLVYSFGGVRETTRPNQAVKETGMLIAALGLRAATAENSGAEIVALDPNGTAALAGLGVGDIINSIDGKLVRTAMDLSLQLSDRQPGTVIELGFMIRGEWQSKAKIRLGTAAP